MRSRLYASISYNEFNHSIMQIKQPMEDTMRPARGSVLFAIFAAFLLLTSLPAKSADHRDAPTIDDYSAVDINDVYMFRNPNDPSRLVIALSTQAVADPLFGSSYHFQPEG